MCNSNNYYQGHSKGEAKEKAWETLLANIVVLLFSAIAEYSNTLFL